MISERIAETGSQTSFCAADVAHDYVDHIFRINEEEERINALRDIISDLASDPETKSYVLPDTGFNMFTQLNRLIQNSFELPVSFTESRQLWVDQTVEDMKAFCLEYLSQRLVLPIPVELGLDNGEITLIAPRYGNIRFSSLVTEEEREGTVKQTIESVSNALRDAIPGTVIFYTSPPGWNGMKDTLGNPLPPHQESQTYLFRKLTNKDIEAITIRSDMNLEESRRFVKLFSDGVVDRVDEIEQIKNIVSSYVITPQGTNFMEIVRALQETMGTSHIMRGQTKRLFSEIYRDLSHINELSSMDIRIRQVLTDFEKRINQNVYDISDEAIIRAIVITGETVLSLARVVNPELKKYSRNETLSFVQTLGGCNGGGVNKTGKKENKGEYTKKICRICGLIREEVGPCNICIECENRYFSPTSNGSIVYTLLINSFK